MYLCCLVTACGAGGNEAKRKRLQNCSPQAGVKRDWASDCKVTKTRHLRNEGHSSVSTVTLGTIVYFPAQSPQTAWNYSNQNTNAHQS